MKWYSIQTAGVHRNVNFPVSNGVVPGGFHGLQVEYLEFIWNPPGIYVDFDKNLAGLPAKYIPHGIHMESTWNCGFHVE